MNRLQHETSPYLLQHASNPVDWYPWSEAALAKAKEEQKPIIVSIGYSTCHWCHVMERESFESHEVAKIMNENFICIKVDREERPDVDAVYMEACQAISGGGGWPLNAFLLPDARPFYAGTYFPPRSAHNRPGWSDLLLNVAQVWQEKRHELEKQAARLTQGITDNNALFVEDTSKKTEEADIEEMIGRMKQRYDLQRGGFGGAPKFPMSQSLELLLDHAVLNKDEAALQLVEHGLQAMIKGGIYDQLRGGFARYTVDGNWRIPHFEKMLYDNGLILRLLAKVQMVSPKSIYEKTIRETIEWLRAEMLSPAGTFYAALDADSEGVEGKFYIWNYTELSNLLDDGQMDLLEQYFGVTQLGNWEEEQTNILYRSDILPKDKEEEWTNIQSILLENRQERVRPGRDEKIILQWNAILISGLTYCHRALPDDKIDDLAFNAYRGLKNQLLHNNQWHRTYKDNSFGAKAFLADLTALHTAELDLYDISFDPDYILCAQEGVGELKAIFGGGPGGLLFLSRPNDKTLPTTTVSLYDNAMPSGNGQYLQLLRRLSSYTGDWSNLEAASSIADKLKSNVLKYPTSFANLGKLLLLLHRPARELVVVGIRANEVAMSLINTYRPDLSIVVGHTKVETLPILKGRMSKKDLELYLCENQSCRLSVSSVEALNL